jgi:hypothetical protein
LEEEVDGIGSLMHEFLDRTINKKPSVLTEAQNREPRDLILRRNQMKAGGHIVLIFALMLTVSAQTTAPSAELVR